MKENITNNDETRLTIQQQNEELDEKDEWEKKTCCGKCCFYLFCCCCCIKYEKTSNFYKKGWRNYLKKEGKADSDKPFQILTNLYANVDNAIDSLQNIRLNPNLVSEKQLRNDLEFYIPQLCTFLLFGEVKAIEEFFVFLCKVCNASFFFAHRVQWFLSAMIENAQEKKNDIISILKMINTLFKSENKNKKNKIEKFYITNSEKYINYIKKNKLYFLYNTKYIGSKTNVFDNIDFNSLNMEQQLHYNKYKSNRDIIIKYSDKEYKTVKNKQIQKLKDSGKIKNVNPNIIKTDDEDNIVNDDILGIEENKNKENKQFEPNDFFIDISNFELNNKNLVDDDDLFEIEEEDDDKNESKNLDLYNDDNEFVNLDKVPKDINFLSYNSTLNFIEHLCDISNDLPKYPVDEQMFFLYNQLNEINKKLPCNVYLPFLKDSARNYVVCHIPLDGVKIFRTKTRCPIMLTFEMIRIDEINKEIKKEEEQEDKVSESKSISSLSNKFSLSADYKPPKKTKKKQKLLNEIIISTDSMDYNNADYDLSKPLLINEEQDKKKKNDDLNYTNTIIINDKKDKKYLEIINKLKNRKTTYNKNINLSKTFGEKSLSLEEDEINTAENNPKLKKKDSKILEKITNVEEIDLEDENIKPNQARNYEDFSNIFGETFEEKEQNLKKTSLFGKFKSHQIFRCIFKTHEDLRQEQFATQLINEFNQIFKLEEVDCWLNTYEIISTGNDSGLVEMVNNSLSLDQLKQKLNNISLHDFYIYYWGKGHANSESYKKAMNNYVSSLAGYSLISYFLKIRDRHNGNILIDNEGHLTHIDFGFLLSNAPGKGLKFENAPFKLSKDMLGCLGGIKGSYFEKFRKLLKQGFLAVFKHRKKIIILVEMMYCGNGRNLDCFEKGQEAIDELKLRLQPKGCIKKKDALKYVDSLIQQSVDNWRTKWYDIFQYYAQGIFY